MSPGPEQCPVFPRPLDLRDMGDGRNYMVMRGFAYHHGPIHCYVPEGTITDFASTPRLLWRVFPRMDVYNRAALIHDYLYADDHCSRIAADCIFLCALLDCGVSTVRATAMFLSVRTFGWMFWHKQVSEGKGGPD